MRGVVDYCCPGIIMNSICFPFQGGAGIPPPISEVVVVLINGAGFGERRDTRGITAVSRSVCPGDCCRF